MANTTNFPESQKLITDRTMKKVLRRTLNELDSEKGRLNNWANIRAVALSGKPLKFLGGHTLEAQVFPPFNPDNIYTEKTFFTYRLRDGFVPLRVKLSYSMATGSIIELDCEHVYGTYFMDEDDEAGNVKQERFIGSGLPVLVKELRTLEKELE